MKSYELVIERVSGGSQNNSLDFLDIETDDPVAYVREREKLPENAELEIDRSEAGIVCVRFNIGVHPVKYEFTEA